MEGKLVGIHRVQVRLADGSTTTYYYAWRGKGAPRIMAKPGTKAFTQEYLRLTRDREAANEAAEGTIAMLIERYCATARYKKLSASTRQDYERMFHAIRFEFGTFPIAAVEARGSRTAFVAWRDTMKDKPRSADRHLALLASMFAWAKDQEMILRNPLERVGKLSDGSRRDVIWTAEQIETVLTGAAPHIRDVACMALWTMQRQSDLLTMPTLAFDGERVSIKQGKTGARVRVVAAPAILPILERAQAAGRQRVLVNSFGQNWSASGFKSSWGKEMARLGIKGVTFHDLRGTAITHAYAHMDRSHDEKIRLIADISGHSNEDAERVIRRHYLAGQDVIDAIHKGTN